jgi:hypothetical protein
MACTKRSSVPVLVFPAPDSDSRKQHDGQSHVLTIPARDLRALYKGRRNAMSRRFSFFLSTTFPVSCGFVAVVITGIVTSIFGVYQLLGLFTRGEAGGDG